MQVEEVMNLAVHDERITYETHVSFMAGAGFSL